MKAQIEINSCRECPYFSSEKVYTADSFEDVNKWICNKANLVISGYVEWTDKPSIPSWCPIKTKE